MINKLWETTLAVIVLAVAVKYFITVVVPVLPSVLILLAVGGGLWLVFGRRARW